MILNPLILALLAGSVLVCVLALVGTATALGTAVGWNPEDASARQLARERRSLLVDIVLTLVLAGQMSNLVLLVATAQRIHSLLPGAMCAAGTFNASRFGYPALLLGLLAFSCSGLWLLVHRASPVTVSTGLFRVKAFALVPIALILLTQNVTQIRFFDDLDPSLVTSCCARTFDEGPGGGEERFSSLSTPGTRGLFFLLVVSTLVAGARSVFGHRSPVAFSALSLLTGGSGAIALVAWVAPSLSALPNHHCPFCLLSLEHGPWGWVLTLLLTAATLTGCGTGFVHTLRRLDPLGSILPDMEWQLCRESMTGFLLFSLLSWGPTTLQSLGVLRPEGP